MNVEGAAPIPSEVVAMELNTIDLIEVIMNQLEGKVYDPSKNVYKQFGKRMVNELGAKHIATFLSSYIARDKILSNLDADKIRYICKEASMALSVVLLMNYKNFGIDKSDLQVVQLICEHAVEVNLARAKDGRTLDHIANIVKINMKQEGKGFGFPRLPGMMGGGSQQEQQQQAEAQQ